MKILHLQSNTDKFNKLKSQMTDNMWQQTTIKYSLQDTYLELEDGTIITEVEEIITHLGGKSPSLTQKIRNVHKAATKVYKQAVNAGEIKATQEEISTRRSICSTCPFNNKKWMGHICTQCGCNIKAKTMFFTESCPLDKW